MANISCILGIKGVTTWDSVKYLGVPIFKNKPNKSDWSALIEKIKKKIRSWGATWLNLAGKLILIKSILNNVPLYQCSIMVTQLELSSVLKVC